MSIFLNVDLTNEMSQILVNLSVASEPANRAAMTMYSGIAPTYTEFNALSNADKMALGLGTNAIYTTALASADLTGIASHIAKTSLNGAPSVTVKLGLNVPRFIVTTVGTPTWFVYYVGPTNTANYALEGFAVVGSVGAVGSAADLEVVNNNLTIGQEFIFQDVNIIMPTNISTI